MRIFTTRAFQEGKIPAPDSFPTALNKFEQVCVLPYIGNAVVGSLVYGSMIRNDCGPASDIDYLMVIQDEAHRPIVQRAAQQVLEKYHLIVQARAISEDLAQLGLHGIDAGFRQHLQSAGVSGRVHGKNPLEILASEGVGFSQALRYTLQHYVKKLANAATAPRLTEESEVGSLKDILEKPVHGARVMIQFLRGSVASELGEYHDTKDDIYDGYEELGLSSQLLEDLARVYDVSQSYIGLLQQRQNSYETNPTRLTSDHPFVTHHRQLLDEIHALRPIAYRFLSENLVLMRQISPLCLIPPLP